MSSATVFGKLERSRYFDDGDAMASSVREDEIVSIVIDWSNELARLPSGQTISSVAYEDSGITTSSPTNTTTTTTCKATGVGETEITVTTSGGYKLEKLVRHYPQSGAIAGDYE